MKKIHLPFVSILILLLSSCKDKVEKPKLTYDTNKTKELVKVDSSQVALADLPIQFEGTKYLIHPVGDLRFYEKGGKTRYGSSSVIDLSFTVSNFADNEITGYLQNLKFQKIDSDSIHPLTDKPILILTATYLKAIAIRDRKQILVYTMYDSDTNSDGKIDTNDIKTLYLSDISGSHFTKISSDLQELIDWSLLESKSRLYFRTVEDTNKNGQFDKDDVLHYNYVNLSNKDWKVSSYNPI